MGNACFMPITGSQATQANQPAESASSEAHQAQPAQHIFATAAAAYVAQKQVKRRWRRIPRQAKPKFAGQLGPWLPWPSNFATAAQAPAAFRAVPFSQAQQAKPAQPESDTAAEAAADDGVGLNLLCEVLKCGTFNSDARAICSLISSSKAAADVVAECCKGTLVLALEPSGFSVFLPRASAAARCNAQAAWLRRNGGLVRGLTCRHRVGTCSNASPGSFQHYFLPRPALLQLLPTLACSTPQLQSLEGEVSCHAAGSAAGVHEVADSLGLLSGLTHLVLSINHCEFYGGPGPVMSSLKKLTALRSCELCMSGSFPVFMQEMSDAGLQHLPASLTSLRLAVRHEGTERVMEALIIQAGLWEGEDEEEVVAQATSEDKVQAMLERMGFTPLEGPGGLGVAMPPLLLGHLTALKELRHADLNTHMPVLDIREGDVLPPNLTALELDLDSRTLGGLLKGRLAAPTVQPLTTLTRLQVLNITTSTLPAAQLQHLATTLTALTAVRLGYRDMKTAAAAAPAWTTLPLLSLELSTYGMSSYNPSYILSSSPPSDAKGPEFQGVLSALSQLSGLTHLSTWTGHVDVTPQQLAATLAPLTSLVTLELLGNLKNTADAEGAAVLSHQLAALPNLVHLTAQGIGSGGCGMPVDADIIAAGANASQLTHLKLGGL